MPPLNPFKPEGDLDSFKMRTLDSSLGFNLDGVAANISVYGLRTLEIHKLE